MKEIVLRDLGKDLVRAFKKLSPRDQMRNPVLFVTYVGAVIVTVLCLIEVTTQQQIDREPMWVTMWIAVWMWFTLLFANFAESLAEGRGKAQTESLRSLRKDINAKKLKNKDKHDKFTVVSAAMLHKDDIVFLEAGDFVPCDGEVIDGIASVDESAITGESAPVIRESSSDRDVVTGGTRILSDWLVIRVTASAGESFIDRMVSLVEGAKRQKTPNEVALNILLVAFTLLFLIVVITLLPFTLFSVSHADGVQPISLIVLITMMVCLSPSTIGGLLSTIGIAGMNRLLKANVLASSGRAVEAAGDVNVLLLDKTGTITHGNRQANDFIPASGVSVTVLAEAAQLSSLADHTPEGISIVMLARGKYNLTEMNSPEKAEFIEFSAETRFSGIRLGDRHILKGAADAIDKYLSEHGGSVPESVHRKVEEVGRAGGTPLVVVDGTKVLGVIHLKDVVKAGIKERLADLRRMGIKSMMITGDNPLTAAAIAAEAGVDDYLAEATPEAKLKLIRKLQAGGELVAMVGDGTNDAPALAQSDVAVVMNSGTQAAKEAGNMIDLDSDPTKLIEIVQIGKQMLMTRGSLTTFSMANDLAKYFTIVPAAFSATYPALSLLDVMGLHSPVSAMLSAVIFNALIIIALIPLALRGVKYRAAGAASILRSNLMVYGVGGLIAPFIGIKLIDLLLGLIGVV